MTAFSMRTLALSRRAGGLALMLALAACTARPPLPPSALSRNPARCLAELDRLGVHYEIESEPATVPAACRVDNPVEVTAATIAWSRPAVASCEFVVEFDRFEREALRPLALRYLGEDVKTILHFGAYSCRTTRAGRESEHAHGLAMDVAGFELADGRSVLVKEDWSKRGAEGRFLHAVASEACRYFNEVLTPDSDRDHYNHMHLDLGPYRLCVRR
jgi:hypothetical protein